MGSLVQERVSHSIHERKAWLHTEEYTELKHRITQPWGKHPGLPWPEDYDLSFVTGFVFEDPLTELPPYFETWNELARNLPELIEHHTLREVIHKMPELDYRQLQGTREQWLAFVIISTVTGAYVWLERDEGVTEVLPRQLAVPLCGMCEDLGVPPIGQFASSITANWKYLDTEGEMEHENLDAIVSLYPRGCFRGFLNVHIMVEQCFADALPYVMEAFDATRKQDDQLLLTSLQGVAMVMKEMVRQINEMHVKCDAWELFFYIRHLLAGWYYDNCPLPDGLLYEGVSDKPKKLMGGSGSQSSTFHTFEVLLGVEHKPETKKITEKLWEHMPPKHSDFLREISKLPSVKAFVMNSEDAELKKAYNWCLKELAAFKSSHMKIVAKYISAQKARKARRGSKQYSDDKGIWSDKPEIYSMLKEKRDDCNKERLPINKSEDKVKGS